MRKPLRSLVVFFFKRKLLDQTWTPSLCRKQREQEEEEKERKKEEKLRKREQKLREREEKRTQKKAKKQQEEEQRKLQLKIVTEERKLLLAQRNLESIRLIAELLSRVKVRARVAMRPTHPPQTTSTDPPEHVGCLNTLHSHHNSGESQLRGVGSSRA